MNAPVSTPRPSTGTRRRRRIPMLALPTWLALLVIVLVGLFTAVGPMLVPADPTSIDLSSSYVGPVAGHPFGFDGQGRDLLARLALGSRTALLGPLLIVIISITLGSTLALLAAWRGGWLDAVVARVVDAMFAFPGLLLAILAVSLFGTSLYAASAALAISYVPYVARLVRSAAIRERNLAYIATLEVQGFSGFRIVLRHILPNIAKLLVATSTLTFGYALIDLASLSFIGLGVQPPTPDWGQMVAEGVPGILAGYPQESLYAALLIVVTIGAVNYMGDRLTAASESGTE